MLDRERIPRHVAIIMDGNGRWAKKRFLPAFAGHNAGMKAMIEIVRHASDIGIGYLTVYAFSTENWKRSKEEVGGIFKLLVRYVDSQLKELHANNVKVNILGADTRNVDGKAFGTMLLGLPADSAEAAKALRYIQGQPNITVEEVPDHG